MIQIVADGDRCTGQGICYTKASELLGYDDEGFVTVRDNALEVPAELEALAREVTVNCPEGALRIIESD